jgi:hypothetical protein
VWLGHGFLVVALVEPPGCLGGFQVVAIDDRPYLYVGLFIYIFYGVLLVIVAESVLKFGGTHAHLQHAVPGCCRQRQGWYFAVFAWKV